MLCLMPGLFHLLFINSYICFSGAYALHFALDGFAVTIMMIMLTKEKEERRQSIRNGKNCKKTDLLY